MTQNELILRSNLQKSLASGGSPPPDPRAPAAYTDKRRNFCKSDCEQYNLITDRLSKQLPPTNTSPVDEEAYQDFCDLIITADKRTIIPVDAETNIDLDLADNPVGM